MISKNSEYSLTSYKELKYDQSGVECKVNFFQNVYLQKLMYKHLHSFNSSVVAPIYLGSFTIDMFNEVRYIFILPVPQLHRASLTLGGVSVGCNDGLVFRSPQSYVIHDDTDISQRYYRKFVSIIIAARILA